MKFFATIVLLPFALSSGASAATLSPIPGKGNALSYVYRIVDVHIAKSEFDVVRLYELCDQTCTEPTLTLQIVADNRPPAGKVARITAWTLAYGLRRVDSIALVGTVVTIDGWSYSRGALTCTAAFSFSKNGILTDALDDRGCIEKAKQ